MLNPLLLLLRRLFSLGIDPHLPDLENRRTYVCNQIALTAFIIPMPFFILNLDNEVTRYFFFAFWACDLLVFILNRYGYLRVARILFVLSAGNIFYALGIMIEAKWPDLKSGFLIIQLAFCSFPLLLFSFQRDLWLIVSVLFLFGVQLVLFYPLDQHVEVLYSTISYEEASFQNDLQYVSGILIIALSFGFYQRIAQRAEERVTDLLDETQVQNNELQAAEEEIRQTAAALQTSLAELDLKTKLLEQSHEDVVESITYAKRIQIAILPPSHLLSTLFPSHYVYYQPRDIVSGDFYWVHEVEDLIYLAVVDCTGHGVPGAFMSVMAYSLLNQIVQEKAGCSGELLVAELDRRVQASLRQESGNDSQDGMDLALCVINRSISSMDFVGANRPLYQLRHGEITEFAGNKFPVGGSQYADKVFAGQRIDLREGDQIMLFTDGITDQFGWEDGKRRKFSSRRLRSWLIEQAHVPHTDASSAFRSHMAQWMQGEAAIDDHSLFVFKW